MNNLIHQDVCMESKQNAKGRSLQHVNLWCRRPFNVQVKFYLRKNKVRVKTVMEDFNATYRQTYQVLNFIDYVVRECVVRECVHWIYLVSLLPPSVAKSLTCL